MNWETFWDTQAQAVSHAKQVGRLHTGDEHLLNQRIAQHIADKLALRPNERLLDVCCGNGELSALLAKKCLEVVGADLSASLLEVAQKTHPLPNLQFVRANSLHIGALNQKFDKIVLYFSFQYFERFEEGKQVIEELNTLLLPGGKLFVGDTPDARKWWVYYNTPMKVLRYFYQRAKSTESMGKFWHPNEFKRIAKAVGLELKILEVPADLPYAHYRFDAVFEKAL
jgi:ubiquinone/menaquinone biosynthesis C-methylase UbiE